MKDTIFVPSFGNKPSNMVGREGIIRVFEENLHSPIGSRERAMLMLGQRGFGKTVLLLELADLAKKMGHIVAMPTVVSREMPERILEKLYISASEHIKKSPPKIIGGNINIMGFGRGLELEPDKTYPASFSYRLSKLCEDINNSGKKVLILIDEAQANSEELRQLIIAYQEMVGEGRDLFLVMAGLPMTISAVLNDHVLTFLNRACKINVLPLRIGDIEAYYQSVFKKLSININTEMIKNAASFTEGSPYLMQLAGHYIVLNADDNGNLQESAYSHALNRAKADYINDICGTSLANLSEQDILYLRAMSSDKQESRLSDIISRLGCTSSFAQTYKRRLLQAGVIEQHKRGMVRFAAPYLKEYLTSTEE